MGAGEEARGPVTGWLFMGGDLYLNLKIIRFKYFEHEMGI